MKSNHSGAILIKILWIKWLFEKYSCVLFQIRDGDEKLIQPNPNISSIVVGPETSDYHMNTFEDLECVHCYRDHFYGQPIEDVSCQFHMGK